MVIKKILKVRVLHQNFGGSFLAGLPKKKIREFGKSQREAAKDCFLQVYLNR